MSKSRVREVVRVFFDGEDVDDELEMVLDEPNERLRITVVYLGVKEMKMRMDYRVKVLAPGVMAEIRVFGVLMDRAEKELKMEICFERGSRGASGEELEDSLNLSKEAKNTTLPILLSAEQSSESKHGVKVGRIDKKQVEYMENRGLEEGVIRKMMVRTKLKQALRWIDSESEKGRLVGLLDAFDEEDD